ncbi:MAG: hypothetical protein FJ098_02685 [Deltaproteobacteria bacterium]|nr:hypothetical protein [Deltaproteobacteria bacterium]
MVVGLLVMLPWTAFADGEDCLTDADCPEDEVCVTPDWEAGTPLPTGTCEKEDEDDVSFDEFWLGLSCKAGGDCPLGFECEEVSVDCDEASDVWKLPRCRCPSCEFVPACPPCVCPFDSGGEPLACGEAPWKLCVFHFTDCEKDQDCTEGLVCHQEVECEGGGLRCHGGGYGKCPECGCPGGDITGEACRACDCWTSFDLVCEDVPRTGCEVFTTCMPPDIECDAAADCPAGWACLLFPDEVAGYCHPPGWEYTPMHRTGGGGGSGDSDSSPGSGEMLVNTASPQIDGGGRKGCSASPGSPGSHETQLLLAGLGLLWIAGRRRCSEPLRERA